MTPRKFVFAFVLVLFLPAVGVPTATAGVDRSQALSNHPLTSMDGKQLKLSSFKGDVVVVNFWASWCPPCRKELPVMDAWNTSWSGRGARVIAISIDKDRRKADGLPRALTCR